MKDAFGNELKIGDEIVYCVRGGSWMELKKTKIIDFTVKIVDYTEVPAILCKNPNFKSVEECIEEWENSPWCKEYYSKPTSTNTPKTVKLAAESYIAKVN